MSALNIEQALPFVAWSRIWSPLTPDAERVEAWKSLGLPGSWASVEPEFWRTFQIGAPTPPVPLILHAALGRGGGQAREDWMRVVAHLGLRWSEHRLQPDHLGAACEVLACAIARAEPVLTRELCARYLAPWCDMARERLAGGDAVLAALPDRWIHRPWEAPARALAAAGVELGRDYPIPIVDLGQSRADALQRFERLKRGRD